MVNAYESAQQADGSALRENEKYLDSIEGKIKQFKNTLQNMWNNQMGSGMVKTFVQLGTLLVGLIDKVGILQSLFIGLMSIKMFKKGQSFNDTFFDMGDNIKKVVLGRDVANTTATEAETASINRNTDAKNRNAQANANASAAENKNTADRLKNKAATDADSASTQANTNKNLENAESNKVASVVENTNTSTRMVQARTHKKKRINKKYQKKYGMVPASDVNASPPVTSGTNKRTLKLGNKKLTSQPAKVVDATTKSVGGLTKGVGLLTKGAKGLWSVVSGFLKANWIGLLLTAIPLVISLVKNIKNTEEKIADLNADWEDLASTAQSSAKEFNSLKTTTDELAPRYAELAQGVNQYGENVSLTDAEFAEFVSLQNQLAELFPELVVGYDANGNAVLNLAGDVDTLTASLKELIEARRLEYAEDMAETLPDLMENITDTVKVYKQQKNNLLDQITVIKDVQKLFSEESAKQYQEAYGENWQEMRKSDFVNMYGTSLNTVYDLVGKNQYQKLIKKFKGEDGTTDWNALFNSEELQTALITAEKKNKYFRG